MGEGVVAGELQAGSEAVGAGTVQGGYWDVVHDVLGRAEAFSSGLVVPGVMALSEEERSQRSWS